MQEFHWHLCIKLVDLDPEIVGEFLQLLRFLLHYAHEWKQIDPHRRQDFIRI